MPDLMFSCNASPQFTFLVYANKLNTNNSFVGFFNDHAPKSQSQDCCFIYLTKVLIA